MKDRFNIYISYMYKSLLIVYHVCQYHTGILFFHCVIIVLEWVRSTLGYMFHELMTGPCCWKWRTELY